MINVWILCLYLQKSLEIEHLILYYRLACVAECATHSLRPLHKTKIGGVSYG